MILYTYHLGLESPQRKYFSLP